MKVEQSAKLCDPRSGGVLRKDLWKLAPSPLKGFLDVSKRFAMPLGVESVSLPGGGLVEKAAKEGETAGLFSFS